MGIKAPRAPASIQIFNIHKLVCNRDSSQELMVISRIPPLFSLVAASLVTFVRTNDGRNAGLLLHAAPLSTFNFPRIVSNNSVGIIGYLERSAPLGLLTDD